MNAPRILSPETETAIQELATQVSRGCEDAVRAEFADHVRDKVQAYLSGEEPVTEADALLLARSHFGAPAKVRQLIRRTHGISLYRLPRDFWHRACTNVLAVVWAMSITYVITALVYVPIVLFPAVWEAVRTQGHIGLMSDVILTTLVWLTLPVAMWRVNRWLDARRVERKGANFWKTWSVWMLAGIMVNVITIQAYDWWCGGWTAGTFGQGVFLFMLPEDPMWIRAGSSYQADWCMLGVWAVGAGLMLTVYLKRVVKDRRLMEMVMATGVWIAATLILRGVIWVMVMRAKWSRGMIDPSYLTESLTHRVVEFFLVFGIHDAAVLVIVLCVACGIIWRRRIKRIAATAQMDV